MATMPRGEPRSVPDEAGELYDRAMAVERARQGRGSSLSSAGMPILVLKALGGFRDPTRCKR